MVARHISSEVLLVSLTIFLIALGEELWIRFLPRYLESIGAPILAIGVFGSLKNFLDAIYQYPGGYLSDRLGYRNAFLGYLLLTLAGYLLVLASPPWIFVYVGLIGMMAWTSLGFPALFSVIGSTLPAESQVVAFSVQSVLKRIPIIISPIIGSWLIAQQGIQSGVRTGVIITVILGVFGFLLLLKIRPVLPTVSLGFFQVFRVFSEIPALLRRLLIADILARIAEGLVDVLVILYVVHELNIPETRYGRLISIQMVTATIIYLPVAAAALRLGQKFFVILTFLFFALFPLAVVRAANETQLMIAFVFGGLREIGEPSRKAMITGFAPPLLRARVVGLYYLIRQLAIAPSGVIGAWIYYRNVEFPFYFACIFGLAAMLFTIFFVRIKDEEI